MTSQILRPITAALLAGAFTLLAGCAEAPPRHERHGGYVAYDDAPDVEHYGAAPYLEYPEYYSVLFPVYYNYYDPWYSPGFYYGVTWFPSTWFGYGLSAWDAWPYYTAYSPYWSSAWDGYYVGYYGRGYYDRGYNGHGFGGRHHRDHRSNGTRFGSASNEAERLARMDVRTPDWRGRQRQTGTPYGQDAKGPTVERSQPFARHAEPAAAGSGRPYGRGEPSATTSQNPTGLRARDAAWRDAAVARPTRSDVPTVQSPYARERNAMRSGWIAPAPGSRAAGGSDPSGADAPVELARERPVEAQPAARGWAGAGAATVPAAASAAPQPRAMSGEVAERRMAPTARVVPAAPSEPAYAAPQRQLPMVMGGGPGGARPEARGGGMAVAAPRESAPVHYEAAPVREAPDARESRASDRDSGARDRSDSGRDASSRERQR